MVMLTLKLLLALTMLVCSCRLSSKAMEQALQAAGVPVESLYYSTEGHGFYVEANRKEFYTRLLAFLNRHIGGSTASVAGR